MERQRLEGVALRIKKARRNFSFRTFFERGKNLRSAAVLWHGEHGSFHAL
jgi:hypothetical protein